MKKNDNLIFKIITFIYFGLFIIFFGFQVYKIFTGAKQVSQSSIPTLKISELDQINKRLSKSEIEEIKINFSAVDYGNNEPF